MPMIREQALLVIGDVLAPLSADRYFAEVLGRQVLHVEGDSSHARTALLGADPKGTILAAWATHPASFGLHANGVTGPPPPRDGIDGPEAFAHLIAAHHARGYTLHIPDLRQLSAPLARFMTALEYMLHQPVKASLFWSRPGNRAPVHYDDRDNISIQLAGAKRWYVETATPSLHNPWRDVAETPQPLGPHQTIDMTPGQMLLIPRGTPHTVETVEESLHLSVTLTPITVREAIVAALEHLSDYDRPLRDTALARSDQLGAELEAAQAKLIAGLERLLQQCRAPGFVASALQRRASRFIGDLPKLPPSTPPAAIGPYGVFVHADNALSMMLATPELIDFALPGAHLNVHRAAEPALRFIAANLRFRVADLPGLSDELCVALIERLLASGFLAIDAHPDEGA